MLKVKRGDFIKYTSKYLKLLPLVVTNRGEDDFAVVKIVKDSNSELMSVIKITTRNQTKQDNV